MDPVTEKEPPLQNYVGIPTVYLQEYKLGITSKNHVYHYAVDKTVPLESIGFHYENTTYRRLYVLHVR